MLEVVSFSDVSEYHDDADLPVALDAVSSRRGGFLHGTKIATTSGWKLIERIAAGDLVRTLDHGFKEVRRVSTSWVLTSDIFSYKSLILLCLGCQKALHGLFSPAIVSEC
ncbi:Hint domain-containing protein [Ruegeria sp.]|uniref:Hint domain-containing protein n=1 Tax=Ruegeria sp. TaxID=1879320 RepID=UPI003B00F42E